MRIIVIDEGAADRKRTTDRLEQILPDARIVPLGRRTDIAEALARGNFDLVLTEYRLSWTDGLALLRSIKHRYPHVPVVFVTLVYSVEVAMSAARAGLSGYVLKRDLDRQLPAVVSELAGAGAAPVEAMGQDEAPATAQRTPVLWTRVPGAEPSVPRPSERPEVDYLRGVVGALQAEIHSRRRENEALQARLRFLEALLSSRRRSQPVQSFDAEDLPGPRVDLQGLAKSFRSP